MAMATPALAPLRAQPNPPASSTHRNGARLQAARRAAAARYLAVAKAFARGMAVPTRTEGGAQ